MGIDPKPSKRRRPQAPNLPMLPAHRTPDQSPVLPPKQPSASPYQTRLPDGPDYDCAVNLPQVHDLMERITGVEADGYYKISPGDEGKTWFVAYKWQHGPYARHYVMARVHRGELGLAFTLLAEKVLAVRAGLRKPTLDRYDG